jgi:hypothetical protein
MAEAEKPATERIESALARIEAAAAAVTSADQRLKERHAALRTRVEEAVGALDAMIARERG